MPADSDDDPPHTDALLLQVPIKIIGNFLVEVPMRRRSSQTMGLAGIEKKIKHLVCLDQALGHADGVLPVNIIIGGSVNE